MKFFILIFTIYTLSFASFYNINSFEADFTQSVTDDKNVSLVYNGHLIASKPQNALWKYIKPIEKDVYINSFEVTIIEPEIEQVIIRKIESDFDFFNMLQNATQISTNKYEANYRDSHFIIKTKNKTIESISYLDEFDNIVKIIFKNQKQNRSINNNIFLPKYPLNFDVIRD
ncbi:MAG: outer membrane lipoprotein chaperone LolA [Epsilonproteobacteria bacterium]|nr:outer membrane lipoprotein chaperone LolA [Campylobacterota bacterium]